MFPSYLPYLIQLIQLTEHNLHLRANISDAGGSPCSRREGWGWCRTRLRFVQSKAYTSRHQCQIRLSPLWVDSGSSGGIGRLQRLNFLLLSVLLLLFGKIQVLGHRWAWQTATEDHSLPKSLSYQKQEDSNFQKGKLKVTSHSAMAGIAAGSRRSEPYATLNEFVGL
jgi:hypothetical protein